MLLALENLLSVYDFLIAIDNLTHIFWETEGVDTYLFTLPLAVLLDVPIGPPCYDPFPFLKVTVVLVRDLS